jgi:hypothetical protein
MGETLRKLANRAIQIALKDKITEYFHPYQLGINCPAGCEVITHTINEARRVHPHWIVVKTDFSNAFNSIYTSYMLQQVKLHFPELYAWVYATYGTENYLFAENGDSRGRKPIRCSRGTQQGDALAPFLFDLTIHPILKTLNDQVFHVEGASIAFHDDFNLLGPPSEILKAWNMLRELSPLIGLQLNVDKCRTFSSYPLGDLQGALPPTHESMEILSVPHGTREFIRPYMRSKIEMIKDYSRRLARWNNHQGALLMLRLCVQTKFNYLLRNLNPCYWLTGGDHEEDLTVVLDSALRDSLADILHLDREEMSDRAWAQAKLRPSSGGLGIIDVSCLVSAAYTASVAVTESVVNKLLRLNGNTKESDAQQLLGSLEQQISNYPDSRIFIRNTTQERHKKLQGRIYETFDILRSCQLHSSASMEEANRVLSASGEGGLLITFIPYSIETIIAPAVYRALICSRLGIAFIPTGLKCQACDGDLDCHGFHLQSQCKLGNYRQARHNAVVATLSSLIRTCGHVIQRESPLDLVITDVHTKKRMDIRVPGFSTKSLNIDVSITDARTLKRRFTCAGAAAIVREQAKNAYYLPVLDPAVSEFSPFVMEVLGTWGPKTRGIFSRILDKYVEKDQYEKAVMTSFWKTRITLTMLTVSMQDCLYKVGLATRQYQGVRGEMEGPLPVQDHEVIEETEETEIHPFVGADESFPATLASFMGANSHM